MIQIQIYCNVNKLIDQGGGLSLGQMIKISLFITYLFILVLAGVLIAYLLLSRYPALI